MNIRNIFKRNTPKIINVKLEVIGGLHCPKCKQTGGVFYYEKDKYYFCEDCFEKITEEEYNYLINIEQREEKLIKLKNIQYE